MENQWSLADQAVSVIADIGKMLDGVSNDNPHRYALRKMKNAATKAAFEGLNSAAEIVDAVRILRDELESTNV